MKLSIATTALLAQTSLCEATTILQAREAKITAAATLPPLDRRAQKDTCNAGKTACGDGNGCCPRGSQCTTSKGGVGVCADACDGATLFCEFAKGVTLCCQPGAGCDYSQSVCTQHSTDTGGVWTLTSTSSAEGTRLPTGPVFTSTSGEGGESSSTTTSEESGSSSSAEETGTSSSEAAGSSTSAATGSATPTKNPKDSGSAVVVSWSAGVLAAVFGIMVAL